MISLDKMTIMFPSIIGLEIDNKLIGLKTNFVKNFYCDGKYINVYTENEEIMKNDQEFFKTFLKYNIDTITDNNRKIKISNLINTINLLNKEFKLERLLKLIEKELCDLLNSEGASILIFNKEKNLLNFFITSGGASGKIEKIDVPVDNSIAGYIFSKNKTFVFNDIENTPFHFKKTDKSSGFITNNIIGTPVRYFDEVIGVLEAVNKKEGFQELDKVIIEIFSKIISNKLLNSKLYEEISSSNKGLILAFASAIDLRDNYTHMHSQNVTAYSTGIAKELGTTEDFVDKIELSAMVHDVGKIAIPDEILNKKGRLTEEEFEIIKSHTLIGADILSDIKFLDKEILNGPLEHHEKLDGSGYPNKKKENQISLIGKILSVADVYDALTTERPYKKPWSKKEAIDFLRNSQDIQFSKKIIDALERFLLD